MQAQLLTTAPNSIYIHIYVFINICSTEVEMLLTFVSAAVRQAERDEDINLPGN